MLSTTEEVAIGDDTRTLVSHTTSYPWRCICALRIVAADNTRWGGTGWLIGSRTVITAGHCVYMRAHGGFVQRIEVIPGCNSSEHPFGSCIADTFRCLPEWQNAKNLAWDYGAIVLPENCSYGKKLGYFGYTSLPAETLQGLDVNLSGYPADKPAKTQWCDSKPITTVTESTLQYDISTSGGESGAPVWYVRNRACYVVGVHNTGYQQGNMAVRINDSVFDVLTEWNAGQ